MDADRFWGWGRLYNPDGSFRTGRTILNAFLHALIAFGVAAVVVAPLAYFAGLGSGAAGGIGAAAGTLAMLVREVIQWATSGSPHLADRLLDIAPAPIGGALGGVACWLLVSRFFLSP